MKQDAFQPNQDFLLSLRNLTPFSSQQISKVIKDPILTKIRYKYINNIKYQNIT